MAALGLEHIAHEAVAASLVFVVAEVEAPKDWHLTWVRGHGLEEGPEEHYEYHVIYN